MTDNKGSTSSTPSASMVVLDSLPYIDPVHEEYETYALALIEEEMKSMSPKKKKAFPTFNSNASALLQEEMKLLQENNRTMKPLVTKEIATFPSSRDEEDAKSAVDKARIEYQTELLRNQMLEASNTNSSSTTQWQVYLKSLEGMVENSAQNLSQERIRIDEQNKQRQDEQEAMGKDLSVLNAKYANLLNTKHQLSVATQTLQMEIDQLKQQQQDDDSKDGEE